MDYQIDWDHTICISEEIKPKQKEVHRLYEMIRREHYERNKKGADEPKIIKKEELKNYKVLIIETRHYDLEGYEWTAKMGLNDVRVDETRQEVTGIQALMRVGHYPGIFKKFTFRMSNYGKLWRAWTQYPTESPAWD